MDLTDGHASLPRNRDAHDDDYDDDSAESASELDVVRRSESARSGLAAQRF